MKRDHGNFYRFGPPNPAIPPQLACWYLPDRAIKERICDMQDIYLGDVLISLRDSGYIARALKLASMITVVPEEGTRADRELPPEFYWVVNSTWRDFVPPLFNAMELEAKRRGLLWNNISPMEEKKRMIALDQRVAQYITEGKAALKSRLPRNPKTRHRRTIDT